jgi:hypothetical protein
MVGNATVAHSWQCYSWQQQVKGADEWEHRPTVRMHCTCVYLVQSFDCSFSILLLAAGQHWQWP